MNRKRKRATRDDIADRQLKAFLALQEAAEEWAGAKNSSMWIRRDKATALARKARAYARSIRP